MGKTKTRGGAPRKAPGGLQKVLYVRVAPELLEALDGLVAKEAKRHPGRVVSRADVARELLYEATKKITGDDD